MMVYEEAKLWPGFLSLVLWSFRTSKRVFTQPTPFSLVKGEDAIVLIEVMVSYARLALARNFQIWIIDL